MSVKRILLRHESRHMYFQQPGGWVTDATDGFPFKGCVQAERLNTQWGSKAVELVFEFDTSENNFAIRL